MTRPKEMIILASTFSLLLATSVFAAPANKVIRQNDNPDEVVMLAQCSKGEGTQMKTNDRILYWADDYARRKGVGSQDAIGQSAIKNPGRHDGMVYHVTWSAGTVENPVSGTFPEDGREFKVWGLPSDSSTKADEPVVGSATLGGAPFKCYQGEGNLPSTFQDGFSCGSVFTCTRLERWIRKTEILLDDKLTVVRSGYCVAKLDPIIRAQDAFGKLAEALKTPWDTATGYDIGGGCKIRFPVIEMPPLSPNYIDTTPQAIVDVLKNQFGDAVEKNRTLFQPNCSPPLYSGDGFPDEWRVQQLNYPRGGNFEISVAQQSNPSWVTQTRVDFRVDCECQTDYSGFLPKIAAGINTFGGFINPVFGSVTSVLSLVHMGLEKC
jgi:hypothetical protein